LLSFGVTLKSLRDYRFGFGDNNRKAEECKKEVMGDLPAVGLWAQSSGFLEKSVLLAERQAPCRV
jgi:hypothetical protein